jgi:hypothetical protein
MRVFEVNGIAGNVTAAEIADIEATECRCIPACGDAPTRR